MDYEQIADEINEELTSGMVEFCSWDGRDCILYYERAHQPNMRYATRDRETPVFIDEFSTKNEILTELKSYWYVQ